MTKLLIILLLPFLQVVSNPDIGRFSGSFDPLFDSNSRKPKAKLAADSGIHISVDIPPTNAKEECHGYIFNSYPSYYLPVVAHQLIGISALGDSVELEDGSVWKINRYDAPSALSFRLNDSLIITQNHRWFSRYHYRIINQETGAILEANLFLGPKTNSQYTWYISAIDRVEDDLLLINGFGQTTRWEISWHDDGIFQNWAVNDAVIIGQNSGWDSRSASLLINVNMDQSVRARQR